MPFANTFSRSIGCQWPDLERETIPLDVWEDYYLGLNWIVPVSLAWDFLIHNVDLQSKFPFILTVMMTMMMMGMMNVLDAIYRSKFFYWYPVQLILLLLFLLYR